MADMQQIQQTTASEQMQATAASQQIQATAALQQMQATAASQQSMQPLPRRVPKRVAQAVISSLKGGVVPRIGLPYITVGRAGEIEALLRDVELIGEGGASFRFIMGRYGSGKSFLLQTIRNNVMEKGFVVMDADLSPERRLQGTRGQGLAT